MSNMEEKYELAEWLAGKMTDEELITFKQTPGYATYSKIAECTQQLETPAFDKKVVLDNILKRRLNGSKSISLYNRKWLKIAAVFMVFLGITYIFNSNYTQKEIALNNQKTTFSLPDNSQVVLNSNSDIEYKKWNWSKNRSLTLTGEAYFKVAHGEKFEVVTKLGKVTVLGTQFNVKARANRFDVSCFEGKVKVNYNNIEKVITKNQSVAFENDSEILIPNNALSNPTWISGELNFNSKKLTEILAEINREYNSNVSVETPNESQLFTGSIPTDNLENALKIICKTYHLKLSNNNQDKTLLIPIDVEK